MTPEKDHDDATALQDLRADFPHLDISIEFLSTYRAWSARGRDGRNLWLVLSTDIGRFRRTLDRADISRATRALPGFFTRFGARSA